jgi:glycine cleavage system aminomethyltransferase T
VVNAGTKDNDFALIQKTADIDAELRRADDRALIALQGPEAEAVIATILGRQSLSPSCTLCVLSTPNTVA